MAKTPEQIVSEIDQIIRRIWKNLDDPEGLSRDIGELAVLYTGLSQPLADARDNARSLETYYKYLVDRDFLKNREEGDAVSVAETKARSDRHKDLTAFLSAKKTVDILQLKREDVEKNLDAARSRLSLIKGDIQRGV